MSRSDQRTLAQAARTIIWRLDLAYRWHRLCEKLLMAVVWMLPRKLVYWCAIRLISHATTGKYDWQISSELTVFEALDRWGE